MVFKRFESFLKKKRKKKEARKGKRREGWKGGRKKEERKEKRKRPSLPTPQGSHRQRKESPPDGGMSISEGAEAKKGLVYLGNRVFHYECF